MGNTHAPIWVTGAGSGVGRAAAVVAAARGAPVVLSGRRVDALEQTARLVAKVGGTSLVLPLNVQEPDEILSARDLIAAELGPVSRLVLAAGLNTPARFWADEGLPDFDEILSTNLSANARLIAASLPGMRTVGDGIIVIVSSYAGWRISPGSGVAYSASKTALSALSASVNLEEAAHGIRCCHLCPGDIDTDFLSMRPNVPDTDARRGMLSPDDVARAVQFVLDSPPNVRIDELVITPTAPGR